MKNGGIKNCATRFRSAVLFALIVMTGCGDGVNLRTVDSRTSMTDMKRIFVVGIMKGEEGKNPDQFSAVLNLD